MSTPKKVVMVSGSNKGIGKAITETLLENGFKVSLGVRDNTKATFSNNDDVLVTYYDAMDKNAPKEWVARTVERFGRIDGLVNNAGIVEFVGIEEGTEEDLQQMLEVNAIAPWRLTRAVFPFLKTSEGRIVNINSTSGHRVRVPKLGGYAMSKFAANALHKLTVSEGWDYGIRATAIHPAFVDTTMIDPVVGKDRPEAILQPSDIAKAVLFALTQDHKFSHVNQITVSAESNIDF